MKQCPSCRSAFPTNYTHCPRDGSPLTETGEWAEGTLVRGKYQILAKVGQGGMAAVYKALHVRFKEPRALKVINPELANDETFVKRFEQEAIITRQLQHPNAVRVEDIDEAEDGRPFIVMEYVEGGNLKDVIEREAPMPVARVCSIVKQIAAALDAAHGLGLVHRDIKPANIALVASSDKAGRLNDRVKVLDFGIAKLKEAHLEDSKVHPLAHMTLTGTGMVIGTPAYMSPEQAKGLKGGQLDGRSDLYSLGVVMYQMLTGDLPLKADSTLGLLMAHISTPPKPIHEIRPDLKIPAAVAAVVMRCLEKNRELRPAGGQALVEEIEFAAGSASVLPVRQSAAITRKEVAPQRTAELPTPPTVVQRSTALRSRPWRWAMVAVLIVGVLGGAWYLRGRKPPAELESPRVASTSTETKPVTAPALREDSTDSAHNEPPEKTEGPAAGKVLSAEQLIAEGNRAAGNGEYDAAITSFLGAIRSDPHNSAARAGLLKAQRASGIEFPDFVDPLTREQVAQLLMRGAAPSRVAEAADEHGIDFDLTPETELYLRFASAGNATAATNAMLTKLRAVNAEFSNRLRQTESPSQHGKSLPLTKPAVGPTSAGFAPAASSSPPPSAPATGSASAAPAPQTAMLAILTNPAVVAAVWVDEKMYMTDSGGSGSLQIPGLSPGQHRLRLDPLKHCPETKDPTVPCWDFDLSRYQRYEETVDLVAGLNTKLLMLVPVTPSKPNVSTVQGGGENVATTRAPEQASVSPVGLTFAVAHQHEPWVSQGELIHSVSPGELAIYTNGEIAYVEYDRSLHHDFRISCSQIKAKATSSEGDKDMYFTIKFADKEYTFFPDIERDARHQKRKEILAAISKSCHSHRFSKTEKEFR